MEKIKRGQQKKEEKIRRLESTLTKMSRNYDALLK